MLNQSLIKQTKRLSQVRIIRIIIKCVSIANNIAFFLKHPFSTITNVKIIFRYYLWPRESDL
jgi:hypothetical protein